MGERPRTSYLQPPRPPSPADDSCMFPSKSRSPGENGVRLCLKPRVVPVADSVGELEPDGLKNKGGQSSRQQKGHKIRFGDKFHQGSQPTPGWSPVP